MVRVLDLPLPEWGRKQKGLLESATRACKHKEHEVWWKKQWVAGEEQEESTEEETDWEEDEDDNDGGSRAICVEG
jgi:hypothetical protein